MEEVLKKTRFYDEMKGECDMHNVDDLVVCLGDINGQGGKEDMEEAGLGRMHEGWCEQGRCTLSIKEDCWH